MRNRIHTATDERLFPRDVEVGAPVHSSLEEGDDEGDDEGEEGDDVEG